MHTVTKKELIDRVAEMTGEKHVAVKKVVRHFLGQVVDELAKGNRLAFREFGVFEVKRRATRAPRAAQTSKTPEPVVAGRPTLHEVMQDIDALSDEERLALDRELSVRLGEEWEREVGEARKEAKRRGIDQAAIDQAIERRRHGAR